MSHYVMSGVLVAAVCCCVQAATWAQAERDVKMAALLEAGAEPVTVVCFGDSVTGIYYHTGSRRAYSDMLAIALGRVYPESRLRVINAGISGHTTADGLARMENDVLSHKPHLVTVMFGLNDMLRVPLAEFDRNLTTIISRCRAIGAEVILCTPNSVCETERRPIAKLEEYVAAVRAVAEREKTPLVDCYAAFEAVRAANPVEWTLLMSEFIHPNMNGHKLVAECIAEAIAGRPVSLAGAGPLAPAIPRTLSLLSQGKPVKVFAMPPYDGIIGPALQAVAPSAQIEVTTWEVAGLSLAGLEESAKAVREMGMDLIVVAVPAEVPVRPTQDNLFSYSWILSWALSFEAYGWDCIAIPPSTAQVDLSAAERDRDMLARRLIRAQDVGTIEREPGDTRDAAALVTEWVQNQAAEAMK
ncbi:MAG: hypothetical protein JXR94_19575 [Candidatus Hydrogenedentes bacterium]|nr:hypothetical protein [Candidatus Hydrogenedentota bacterium]